MHWFDMAVAGPEIARVLSPRGVLAGLWNVVDDRVGWVRELARVGGPAVLGPRDLLSTWRDATASTYLSTEGASPFGRPETSGEELVLPILTGVLRLQRR